MVGGEADCPVNAADILDNKRIKRQNVWVPWDSHDHIMPNSGKQNGRREAQVKLATFWALCAKFSARCTCCLEEVMLGVVVFVCHVTRFARREINKTKPRWVEEKPSSFSMTMGH
jgi:hypothetical protein